MSIVLVTGGSSGIGRATVRRLADAGHVVFAASRDPERAPLPDGVTAIVLDVADPAGATAAVGAVLAAAGRIDALVNNAGTGSFTPMEEVDDAEAHRIFEVNLFGPMRLALAAVPAMRSQGGGRIVNVTSMNDVLPAPFGGWYSASKAAFASASAVLDAEVHKFGIFVTVVAPGLFDTPMAQGLPSFRVGDGSPYRPEFDGMIAENRARITQAGDPDVVAIAIENCLASADPPGRLVVGTDAESMERLVRSTEPDAFTRLMREYVAGLPAKAAGGH